MPNTNTMTVLPTYSLERWVNRATGKVCFWVHAEAKGRNVSHKIDNRAGLTEDQAVAAAVALLGPDARRI